MSKIRFLTPLAVLMLVAAGTLNGLHTDAKTNPRGPAVHALNPTPAAPAAPDNWGFAQNHGRITRLYPSPDGVYFTFGGKPGQYQTAMNPTNGYYFIPNTHTNYQALVNLLYLAAENDWNLQARTQPTLGTAGRAEVIYLVQDFNRP
ncbi:MAG: hypothetical protein JOZ96_17330 [Acidobacteria bacterium]|nr:hypothetical protein [Acidobacteriota bacterium]